jgi:hypothetical protein
VSPVSTYSNSTFDMSANIHSRTPIDITSPTSTTDYNKEFSAVQMQYRHQLNAAIIVFSVLYVLLLALFIYSLFHHKRTTARLRWYEAHFRAVGPGTFEPLIELEERGIKTGTGLGSEDEDRRRRIGISSLALQANAENESRRATKDRAESQRGQGANGTGRPWRDNLRNTLTSGKGSTHHNLYNPYSRGESVVANAEVSDFESGQVDLPERSAKYGSVLSTTGQTSLPPNWYKGKEAAG